MSVGVTYGDGWSCGDATEERGGSLFGRVVSGPYRQARSAAVLCLALGATLLVSTPAFAAGQREHVFGFAFGEAGTGNGQFAHPSGVGVNDTTGDVYVGDRENGRVEQFEPELSSGGELVGEKFVTQFAVPSPRQIAVDNCATAQAKPCSAAEDPSVGDVYVIGSKAGQGKNKGELAPSLVIYKFNPAGEPLGTIKLKSAAMGIAVDPAGALFVYQENRAIVSYGDAQPNVPGSSVGSRAHQPQPVFAVEGNGAEDNFYVGHHYVTTGEAEGPEESPALKPVLAELEQAETTLIGKVQGASGELLVRALNYESATAAAFDPAEKEVFAVDVAIVAGEPLTSVSVFSSDLNKGPEAEAQGEGTLVERLGAPGLKEGDGVAVASGATGSRGAVFVSDGVSNRVDVFGLEPAAKPRIGGVSSQSPQSLEAPSGATELVGQLSPAGSSTEAYFEYGTASCEASPCSKTTPGEVGAGFGVSRVAADVSGLAPGAYHYRLVAENENGTSTSSEQTFLVFAPADGLPDGRAWEMVSPPSKHGAEPEAPTKEGGLIQAAADGQGITYVASGPMPYEPEPEGNRGPNPSQILSHRDTGAQEWVSQDITTPNETAPGVEPGLPGEYQIFSTNLALSLVAPLLPTSGPYAKPPLSPLLEGEEPGKQQNTFYLRDDAPFQPEPAEASIYAEAHANGSMIGNPGYVAVVNKTNTGGENEPGAEFGGQIQEENPQGVAPSAATPDLSHVVFRAERGPTEVAPGEVLPGKRGLYEWSAGKIELVNVLPGGQRPEMTSANSVALPHAYLGGSPNSHGLSLNTRHAISDNGQRVIWTYVPAQKVLHLELRESETPAPETIQLDAVQGGSGEGAENAVYQTASRDGSKIFFTDEQRLTADSGATAGSPDLYVAEVEVAGGVATSNLQDLTAQHSEGADVLVTAHVADGVVGASEDGSRVYFVANGALAPGASRGHCSNVAGGAERPVGTTCNLFVRQFSNGEWQPTRFIAALSTEDSPDWGDAQEPGNHAYLTSRVSPNGNYLAFMSDRSLTGYDNEDVSSKKKGERLDEEVFLYDAARQRLVCASCNPNGTRPHGVFDNVQGIGDGEPSFGLAVDKLEIWTANNSQHIDHWLAGSIPGWNALGRLDSQYQPRYLSDSGRLFFNSADALVAVAQPLRSEQIFRSEGAEGIFEEERQVGVENVYEYEPEAAGGACHSSGGCLGLISSGTSEHESAFLDASDTGDDVFFLTAKPLTAQDRDGSFDIYDAHVCQAGSECLTPPVETPAEGCESDECQGPFSPGQTPAASGTAVFSGPGNLIAPKTEVLGKTETKPSTKPKPLTRAQKLAKALRSCRTKYRSKSKAAKRLTCEKQARKKYGPIKSTAKKTSSTRAGVR